MLRFKRLVALLFFAWVCALFATLGNSFLVPSGPVVHASPAPDGTTLLLVHGYVDTCLTAFDQKDMVNDAGPNATTTRGFLIVHGWNAKNIKSVGYYANSNLSKSDQYDNGCDEYLQQDYNGAYCSGFAASSVYGSRSDPIEHLGCLLAWYIYNTYTVNQIPVSILAHSMGGLVVRSALGESGQVAGFPNALLDVRRVVTVGTPHAGLAREYAAFAKQYSDTTEVENMIQGSPFMGKLALYAMDPQGLYGTYWALMASSVACPSIASIGLSCSAVSYDAKSRPQPNDPYPWGDMVVQASSALAMNAQFKILYGSIYQSVINQTVTADAHTEYQHESNSCGVTQVAFIPANLFCLLAPFYLNDGTVTNSTDPNLSYVKDNTTAWVCWHDCNNVTDTSLSDMGDLSQPSPVLHSLAEINSLLNTPPIFSNAATNLDGREEVFYRASNNDIWHDWWGGSSWNNGGQLQSLSDPGLFSGDPVVGENANGKLEVFALGIDNNIWHTWQNASGWSSWSVLPTDTAFTGRPSVARNPDGRLELFARAANGRMWRIAQSGANGSGNWAAHWSELQAGTLFHSDPVVAINSNGRLEVFARRDNDNIDHIWQDPDGYAGWDSSGWVGVTNGYTFTNTPSVARNTDGRLELFSRGSDGNTWHIWQASPGGSWNATWSALHAGATFPSDASPAVAQNNNGHLEVFVRGNNNNVYHMWQDPFGTGGWNSSGWSPVATNISGNHFIGTPAIAHNSVGQFEIFMQDNIRVKVWHNWYDVNTSWNSSWSQLP